MAHSLPSLPQTGPYRLAHARVPLGMVAVPGTVEDTGEGSVDVAIDVGARGEVLRVLPSSEAAEAPFGPTIDLAYRHVWPRLTDIHTHLDKTHTWARATNADGSFTGAKEGAKADRAAGTYRREDVTTRMDFALRCALAHGTGAIRTHLDSQPGRTSPSWEVFADMRDAWAGRITLQAVASFGVAKIMGDYGDEVAALVREFGGLFGPVIYPDPKMESHIRRSFDLAEAHGLDLDFHVDEHLNASSNGLLAIAEEALRRGFEGAITCGHNCALSVREPDDKRRTLDAVLQAGIGLVALPSTNLFMMDRKPGRSPNQRGQMPVLEVAAAGVPVAFASDNCRDPFNPFGDYNLIEIFREGARLGHADQPLGGFAQAVGPAPRAMMGLSGGHIEAGAASDLVIFESRTFSELLSRPSQARRVVIAGQAVEAPLPAHRELDPLFRGYPGAIA